MTAATSTVGPSRGRFAAAGSAASAVVRTTGVILVVLLVIIVWIRIKNPNFTDPPVFLNFLRRASPLMILAAGQLFVVAGGGFDLSVGSIVTATGVVAARYSDGDPANTWWLIPLLLAGGAFVGLVNGLVVTKLKVPSFIATLAMLLVLAGAISYWSGGSPRGSFADNFRQFGRDGWESVPIIEVLPYAVVLMVTVAVAGTVLLARTDFGHQVLAVGGGPRAAALSGVHVHAIRIGTFVISGVAATIAGIVLAGITGVSDRAGDGLEFRAISAVVLGGAVLGGGKAVLPAAILGALTLESIFTLLNLLQFAEGTRSTVQGLVIIVAIAFAALRERTRRAAPRASGSSPELGAKAPDQDLINEKRDNMRQHPGHRRYRLVGVVAAMALVGALSTAAAASTTPDGEQSAGRQSEWYDEEQFNRQLAARDGEPVGPEGEPWLQSIDPTMVDTREYAAEGPYEVCFSNTDVGNPWRVVGFTTMEQEVALHPEIETFTVVDAGGSEEKQIADIAELVASGNCDILIVSPASTAALTPAIEAACEELPVIVFDRGVATDCPVTFIHPAGGYAFGADAADFLVDNVEAGGNIVALRILPGVDVLETRWVAGQIIMEEAGLNIIASEFTDGDAAKVKTILQDLIDRGEQIDGVWMDAGATTVAAIEVFEENGLDVPPITGEDQQDFLIKWRDEGLTAVAPTYPTYQWRTPILAALMVLAGEEIPGGEWLLPQPVITSDNLEDFINEDMPPLFYAMCGCQEMEAFPDAWL